MTADGAREGALLVLMYGLVPLWLLAGLGDWACHRRTRIEANAGAYESALHLLMLIEVGAPVLLALFVRVNALVLLIMAVMVVLHAATAWWDIHYTHGKREIGPTEQHMHGLLEVLPMTALVLVALAHWDQTLSIFGAGAEPADFALAWKTPMLPAWYIGTVVIGSVLLAVLPFAEEYRRCWHWRRQRSDEEAAEAIRRAREAARGRGEV